MSTELELELKAQVAALVQKTSNAAKVEKNEPDLVLGFRQFSMQGLNGANAEFKLVCLAPNLRRMRSMQMR